MVQPVVDVDQLWPFAEVLPPPAHGEGAVDEGSMRVVWAEVPLASAMSAAQSVYASFIYREHTGP